MGHDTVPFLSFSHWITPSFMSGKELKYERQGVGGVAECFCLTSLDEAAKCNPD